MICELGNSAAGGYCSKLVRIGTEIIRLNFFALCMNLRETRASVRH